MTGVAISQLHPPPSPPAIHQRYFNLNNFENNFVQKNLTVRKVTR